MKNKYFNLIFLLLIFFLDLDIKGQSIIIKESNQSDGAFFYKLNAGKIMSKAKFMLKKPQYILYWGTDGSNVYGTDGNNIYSLDFTTKKTRVIYTSKEWINNFFVRNNHIYFTMTLTPNIDENEGRYTMKKHKITVLDCMKKVVLKQIVVPFNCNIIGLSISPNEQKIVFVNTLNIDSPKKTSYELVGFDITERKKVKYDKAYYSKNQWFVEGHTYNSLSWKDNDNFYYLKKMGKEQNKGVYLYNLKQNISTKIFVELPQRDINWFIWDNNSILYSNRKNIISFDGKKEKIIYTHSLSVTEGVK